MPKVIEVTAMSGCTVPGLRGRVHKPGVSVKMRLDRDDNVHAAIDEAQGIADAHVAAWTARQAVIDQDEQESARVDRRGN